MYTFFDNHGKKLMAVLVAFLALVFLLPAGFNGFNGGGHGRLGKINGKAVDVAEVQQAQVMLASLNRLLIPQQTQDGLSTFVPAPVAILGKQTYDKVERDPLLLYLLIREAQEVGAVVDSGSLDRALSAPAQYRGDNNQTLEIERVNPLVKEQLKSDLARLASVSASLNRVELAFKVSRPLVDEQLARVMQQVKIKAAAFATADFEKVVPNPTAEEVQRQFDAYKDVAPAAIDSNPFGFGYRQPDRLKVQYLVVPDAEAAKAVEASRSAEKWEEDAYLYYSKNATEFASTQPASTSQPATQPLTRPFEEVKAAALEAIRRPLIEQKKREVAGRIVQRLNAVASGLQPTTGPSVTLDSADFSFQSLQTLADAIQKQTGVRPTVVAPAGLLSHADLAKQEGFAGTIHIVSMQDVKTGPDYLFDTFAGLQNSTTTATKLDLGKPSVVLSGGNDLYIARVVGYAKSQPAVSLDSAKADVERDVRISRAFDLAAAAAQAALDKGKAAGGLDKAAVPGVQTSDYFNAVSAAPAGLTGAWAGSVAGPAFQSLRGLKSAGELPTFTLAKLRHDGFAVAIEVVDMKTMLNTTIEPMVRRQAGEYAMRGMLSSDYVEKWFTLDAVSRRIGYVPDAAPAQSQEKGPRPVNPLLPG
ncbi:MAG: hypothetical protein QM754_06475 [Tepidisphaeraceae bacterium]